VRRSGADPERAKPLRRGLRPRTPAPRVHRGRRRPSRREQKEHLRHELWALREVRATAIELGTTRISASAREALCRHRVAAESLLARHRAGDWGDVAPWVREANERGAACGTLITSRYKLSEADEVWVLTGGVPRVTDVVTPANALAEQAPWPA
jgi:hypothetical protein